MRLTRAQQDELTAWLIVAVVAMVIAIQVTA